METFDKPPIALVRLAIDATVLITDYDCGPAEVERFARSFRSVWEGRPELVRVVLERHWGPGGRKLSVLLTEAPPPWGRQKGFASACPDGTGMYCWSGVLEGIPEEHLQTDIAHELGHMTFLALGEPAHAERRLFWSEIIIAALQETWGFNQAAADDWKERHLHLGEDGPCWRSSPTSEEEYAPQRKINRENLLKREPDIRAYREKQQLYFKVATGTCSPLLDQIVRSDPATLGKILRGEQPEPSPEGQV